VAAALVDAYPGFASFTDEAVRRTPVRELVERVQTRISPGGDGLLAGEVQIELTLTAGTVRRTRMTLPPGAPGRPPTDAELDRKIGECAGDVYPPLSTLTWPDAPDLLRQARSPRR